MDWLACSLIQKFLLSVFFIMRLRCKCHLCYLSDEAEITVQAGEAEEQGKKYFAIYISIKTLWAQFTYYYTS